MKKKRGWGNRIYCEESSPLYWEVYYEMNGGGKHTNDNTNIKSNGSRRNNQGTKRGKRRQIA
jgi:hypothetical protein